MKFSVKMYVFDKNIFETNIYSQKYFIKIHLFYKNIEYFTRGKILNVFIEYVYRLLETKNTKVIKHQDKQKFIREATLQLIYPGRITGYFI